MRLKIRHQTKYAYGTPARAALQVLRMMPRPTESQFIKRWRVEIDADSRLERGEDAYGNITHTVFVEGPLDALTISIEGEADTIDTGGSVRGTIDRLPRQVFLRETSLTRPSPELRGFAADIASAEGGNRLAALHAIMFQLHKNIRFDVHATTTSTTAREAFAAGKGVCQDFAHIFCAAARSISIPARYVSGYYLRTDTYDQEAGHAWAEAFVDKIGWIGFDPANCLCVTDRYLRVATGLDYLDAAPVRGTHQGGAGETLAVKIYVEPGRQVQSMGSDGMRQSQG